MEQHFVTFYSPGTFVAETTTKPIDAWDVNRAVEMALHICERYHARPYGFRFHTRARTDQELDSTEVARSGMYYLNCKVETLADIQAQQDPKDKILISNMECNRWDRIVTPKQGWRWAQPLLDGDVVLPS